MVNIVAQDFNRYNNDYTYVLPKLASCVSLVELQDNLT